MDIGVRDQEYQMYSKTAGDELKLRLHHTGRIGYKTRIPGRSHKICVHIADFQLYKSCVINSVFTQ